MPNTRRVCVIASCQAFGEGESLTIRRRVTHSGVSLAPILGRYVSEEVLTGSPVDSLAPYRPTRFAGGAAS